MNERLGWRPSIHMPKTAARIFLLITDVRVEQVQDITKTDSEAEGFYCIHEAALPFQKLVGQSFESGWDTINAKRGYSYDANPWVWVYTFKQIARAE